jgi:hypothetical protein
MKTASRLTLVLAMLIGIFVLGVAVAVGTLLTLQSPGMAAVVAVALLAGVIAAGLTYLVARTTGLELDEDLSPPSVDVEPIEAFERTPAAGRSIAIPSAELPAPYLAAVMKGLQASRSAMRGPLH